MKASMLLVPSVILILASSPGMASNTFQEWSFDQNPDDVNNVPPDNGAENPNGAPKVSAPGAAWFGNDNGRTGILKLLSGGVAVVTIPNENNPKKRKSGTLVVTYRLDDASGFTAGTHPTVVDNLGRPMSGTWTGDQPLENGWRVASIPFADIDTHGCPLLESASIPAPAGKILSLDKVRVLTECKDGCGSSTGRCDAPSFSRAGLWILFFVLSLLAMNVLLSRRRTVQIDQSPR